ncbi:MAG: hypothetical protein NTX22_07800 [Ignavibacteriales bacterium]|nr:hypothetical protein [Ignavibacteriales bacterium]
MKKKSKIKKDEALATIKFCTECGEELDDFSVSDNSSSEAALKQHHNCRKTGKFNGDMCSRVFITKYDENENLEKHDDLEPNEDEVY